MLTRDLLKEKAIIIAVHDSLLAKQIETVFQESGFLDIRCVVSVEEIYAVLKLFSDQTERFGLIVIDSNLPQCNLESMLQSLCLTDGVFAIPFVILQHAANDQQKSNTLLQQALEDQWLIHQLTFPFDLQQLLLAALFLLKLRRERLSHSQQKQQLLLELSTRSQNHAKSKYLAAHDELTGFFNRSTFERELKLALNRSQKLQKDASLIFLEVDRFCLISEWKGFDAGDGLLVDLANVIRKHTPKKSVFARVGVNEFCIFLQDIDKRQAQQCAEYLKIAIESTRFVFGNSQQTITISIGISSLRESSSAKHPAKFVLEARQACNVGKAAINKIGLYDADDSVVKTRKSDIYWAPLIEAALAENRLFLVFQPVVELSNGVISHYEVMVRMRSEDDIIPANFFIPVAERMGLIEAIDLWVIESTIDFLAALPSHRSYVSVAIKLSADASHYSNLTDIIQDKLELTWVDASRLIFEFAESAVLNNLAGTRQLINKLRALGCKAALKNGASAMYSLDKVKSFPFDYIKIDGQFMQHWFGSESDPSLLKSVIETIAKLGKKAIFVYVESPKTVITLRACGATLAQGFTLGKPECNLLEGPSIPFVHYLSERHLAEKALNEKESYLRVLLDNIPFLVWLKDTQSRFLAVNRKLAQEMGIGDPEAVVGKNDFDYYPAEKAQQYRVDDQEVLALRQRKMLEQHTVNSKGAQRWSEIFVAPVLDKTGQALGTLGLARDITERKRIEADLRVAATAFESQEGMVVTDADTVVLKINHSFTRITGYTAEEAIGRKINLLQSETQNADFYAEMWRTVQQTGHWQGEIWNRRKDGEMYPEWLSLTAVKADDGSISHYVGTMIDITARRAIEEQLRHIAHYDVLTDLPNRILLADRLQLALAQARRESSKLALMYVDLDNFKPVNDNFGHDVGDQLLKDVAARLLICMKRESDTVCRLGGDEFVILLTHYDKDADMATVAENILTTLSQPFFIDKHLIKISSSIGIATYPAHGVDAMTLMKNADNAMYEAKHAGRSCFKFYVYETVN